MTWYKLLLAPTFLLVGGCAPHESTLRGRTIQADARKDDAGHSLLSPHSIRLPSEVTATMFSRDGNILAAGTKAGTIHIVDITDIRRTDIRRMNDIRGDHGEVYCLGFTPKREMLFWGDGGGLHFWDLAAGRPVSLFKRCGTVFNVALSRDGRLLAIEDKCSGLHLWDLEAKCEIGLLPSPAGHGLHSPSFGAGGSRLAATMRTRILLWNIHTCQQERSLEIPGNTVNGIAFLPDDHTLASISADGHVRFWNSLDGTVLCLAGAPAPGEIPDSGELALALQGDCVLINAREKMLIYESQTGLGPLFLTARTESDYHISVGGRGDILAARGEGNTLKIGYLLADFHAGIPRDGQVEHLIASHARNLFRVDTDGFKAALHLTALALGGDRETRLRLIDLLRIRLQKLGDESAVQDLLREMDRDDVEARDRATRKLTTLEGYTTPLLEKAMTGAWSEEVKSRVRGILKEHDKMVADVPPMVERLRAIRILGHTSDPEAEAVLRERLESTHSVIERKVAEQVLQSRIKTRRDR